MEQQLIPWQRPRNIRLDVINDVAERRTQAFVSALYVVADDVNRVRQALPHDLQRRRSSLGDVQALLASVFEVRDINNIVLLFS